MNTCNDDFVSKGHQVIENVSSLFGVGVALLPAEADIDLATATADVILANCLSSIVTVKGSYYGVNNIYGQHLYLDFLDFSGVAAGQYRAVALFLYYPDNSSSNPMSGGLYYSEPITVVEGGSGSFPRKSWGEALFKVSSLTPLQSNVTCTLFLKTTGEGNINSSNEPDNITIPAGTKIRFGAGGNFINASIADSRFTLLKCNRLDSNPDTYGGREMGILFNSDVSVNKETGLSITMTGIKNDSSMSDGGVGAICFRDTQNNQNRAYETMLVDYLVTGSSSDEVSLAATVTNLAEYGSLEKRISLTLDGGNEEFFTITQSPFTLSLAPSRFNSKTAAAKLQVKTSAGWQDVCAPVTTAALNAEAANTLSLTGTSAVTGYTLDFKCDGDTLTKHYFKYALSQNSQALTEIDGKYYLITTPTDENMTFTELYTTNSVYSALYTVGTTSATISAAGTAMTAQISEKPSSDASLGGTITNQGGDPVKGAPVKVTQGNDSFYTATLENGKYAFDSLISGSGGKITVSRGGYTVNEQSFTASDLGSEVDITLSTQQGLITVSVEKMDWHSSPTFAVKSSGSEIADVETLRLDYDRYSFRLPQGAPTSNLSVTMADEMMTAAASKPAVLDSGMAEVLMDDTSAYKGKADLFSVSNVGGAHRAVSRRYKLRRGQAALKLSCWRSQRCFGLL